MKKQLIDNYVEREKKITELEFNLIQEFVKLRKEKNYSQQQIADKCEVIRTTVARIENCITSPQMHTMLDLLESIGYTLTITKLEDNK